MPDKITVRPLTSGDEAEWRRLWTGYLEYYETSVPEEVYTTTFARLLSADHPNQNALLALQDGQPVGLVHYIYHPHNWKVEEVCYLQDLYADPAAPPDRGGLCCRRCGWSPVGLLDDAGFQRHCTPSL